MEQNDVVISSVQASNKSDERSQNRSYPYLTPISIVIAGVLIGGAVLYSRSEGPLAPQLGAQIGTTIFDPKEVAGDAPFLGDPNAPVTIVEFSDFQCPFCGKFFRESEGKIISQYVATGKAKFAYRDFTIVDSFPGVAKDQKESHWAAEASRCANDQGVFWQYHDYLFAHQDGENQGAFSIQNLKKFARDLKLDNVAKFDACLDAHTHLDRVRKDTEDGRKYGVDGTPSVFINGKKVTPPGALPFSEFQAAIEAALAP